MTTEEIIKVFDKLLCRDKIISSSSVITDVICQLDLNYKAQPVLVGTFYFNDTFHTKEYIYIKDRWTIQDVSPAEPTSVDNSKIKTEEALPLEVKVWFQRLPADPDEIPKGQQREWLKEIPIEMLHKKYPPKNFPVMYKWLNLEEDE